jgi:hypothetical protein
MLTDTDSAVRFKERADYVLKAAFTDPAAEPTATTASVKVYPVPGISYKLPETAHPDTEVP